MFEKIIHFSVEQKFVIFLLVIAISVGGIYSLKQLPIDAVPDITNNQVQVVTTSPTLAPQEVEQLITFPIEISVANIPRVVEIRSISRYGLSVVTIVFEDGMSQLDARQFVQEQLNLAAEEIPAGLGTPELMPITTGLGEIYQYTLQVEEGYEDQFDPMELRTIQDWIVKRQMSGIPGIIEISSFGGFLKEYEVAIDPMVLAGFELTLTDVFNALEVNNQNSGGSYIEKSTNAYYIRSEGRVNSIEDIENIVIKHQGKSPVLVKDVAKVKWGSPKRYGAMTKDGKGEAVGGIALMLKGANSSIAIKNVQDRVERIQKSLPEGVSIQPYLDRSDLVGRAIDTVSKNLIEGGLIVIFVLLLLLGNWRAGLIVASVIPLSMLFAFILMNIFGVSANLMSLGAIDFGIVVDGAVIIVENALHVIYIGYVGKKLSQVEMNDIIKKSSSKIYQSAAFGVLIILVVFLPVITLTGVEGKMFKPMALTVSFALLGALILSLTYVPMITSLLLKKNIKEHKTFSDKLVTGLRNLYKPVLTKALQIPRILLGIITITLAGTIYLLSTLGAEFIPNLEEGDLAMQMSIPPGSSLQQSVKTANHAEKILLDNFPEIRHVVSKIGTSEVPTDPMAIEDADIMIILKDKSEWVSAPDRESLVAAMKEQLEQVPGASFEFTQPIQLRFNELMTGAKTDIAIKIFGENVETLASLAQDVAASVVDIPGAADVKVEQTKGLTQLVIDINREKLAQYNVSIDEVNQVVRTAYAGEKAGVVFENEKKFDLVLRYDESYKQNLDLNRLFVTSMDGDLVPLNELADQKVVEGPMQITRENAQRRITIGVNIRNRDVASLVQEIEETISSEIDLPAGYYVTYGGQFENLEAAQKRLSIAVPAALLMIFVLLYFAFKSVKYAALIFSAVPMSAIGGVVALWARGMPFSISAGIGFIALFGVAVLNGIVLISYYNELRKEGKTTIDEVVIQGSLARLRPVLMTAAVAAFGFLPMALSVTAGAEVQKPLATVVIGGLISSTLLTLFILPNLYVMFNKKVFLKAAVIFLGLICFQSINAQDRIIGIDDVVQLSKESHPDFKNLALNIEQSKSKEKATFQLGATSFNYTYGEINDAVDDWHWQLDQSLGNLFQMSAAKKAAEANTEYIMQNQVLTERWLESKVRGLWFKWYFASEVIDQLDQWLPDLESLNEGLKQARDIGEVSLKDQLSIESIIIQLNKLKLDAQLEQESSLVELSGWCGQLISGSPAAFDLNTWLTSNPDSLSNDIIKTYQAEQALFDSRVKEAKSVYAPEISLGYFQQRIVNLNGLSGFRAGISMPLISSAPKQKARIIELEKEARVNQQNQEIIDYEFKINELSNNKSHLLKTLDYLPNSSKMNENWIGIKSLLNSGDINAFEWSKLATDHINYFDQKISIYRQLVAVQLQLNFLTAKN